MLARRFASATLALRCSSIVVSSRQSHTVAISAAVSPLCTTRRYCSASATASTSNPSDSAGSTSSGDGGNAGSSNGTALDVAMNVNKLKRLHQTGQAGRKQLEMNAWKELNTLSEDQINNAEGKAVALLLNSWAYFAKHWERGKEGPLGAASSTEQQQQAPDSKNKQ